MWQPGVTASTLTNGSGAYEFPALDSGAYDISAAGKGWATYSRPGVQLVLQQRLRLDIMMTLASVRQTVEVTDAPALVDTDSASASHTGHGRDGRQRSDPGTQSPVGYAPGGRRQPYAGDRRFRRT